MDLVVLLSEDLEDKAKPPAFGTKGKGRSGPGVATKVELWRMSGSKVWEVMVTGRVLGLAWSRDGEYEEGTSDSRLIPITTGSQLSHLDRRRRYRWTGK